MAKNKDESEKELKKTIAEAEKLKDAEEETPEDVEPEDTELEDNPEDEEEVPETPEEPEIEPEEPPEEPEPPKPDYKKKFSESARNAQRIRDKNKKINEAIDKGKDIPEPTDEEMKLEFPDWDVMEDFSKKLAKETVVNKKFRENLAKAREAGKKIEKWNEQVDKFTKDPETLTKNPDLEGRLEEFKTFATDESNASVPFDVLVPAFLHNSNVKSKNKGQMFPKGSPGPSDPGKKDDRLTIEEGRALRKRDHKKWKRYLKAGKIKIDL